MRSCNLHILLLYCTQYNLAKYDRWFMSLFNKEMPLLSGAKQDLSEYEGKVVLIVNTASKCGFTYQYEGLEALYEEYKAQGLEILGFPCNQFGEQEKGADGEIASFCQKNYGVSFPMFSKIDVNGDNAAPLYQELKVSAPGIMGTKKIYPQVYFDLRILIFIIIFCPIVNGIFYYYICFRRLIQNF